MTNLEFFVNEGTFFGSSVRIRLTSACCFLFFLLQSFRLNIFLFFLLAMRHYLVVNIEKLFS